MKKRIVGEWVSRSRTEKFGDFIMPVLFVVFLAGVIYLAETVV